MNAKVLVLSDTHGCLARLEAVLEWAKELSPGLAVFLGDGIDDVERAATITGFSCNWQKVRGNNDFDFSCPATSVFDFSGHGFFICHGQNYKLYDGLDTLAVIAKNNNASVALFGHTHVPHAERRNETLLLNPGSIGNPRSNAGATFAVIDCSPGIVPKPEFFRIYGGNNIRAVSADFSF